MMKSPLKMLLLVPTLFVTACGYGLKEVYEGVPYNSSNFFNNYYEVWNDSINPYSSNHKITELKDEVALDETEDKVFTSTNDTNFKINESNYSSYAYEYDLDEPADTSLVGYGPAVKLSNQDKSFKYGVQSKLFDGQMFCNGYYANARVQVRSQNEGENSGFAVLFSKECNNASYVMMNFKCSVVKENNQNLGSGYSDIVLHFSLIYKNDNGYTYVPVSYALSNVPTNSGDNRFAPANRFNLYTCFGFNLQKFNESTSNRLIGFSFQYEKTYDSITKDATDTYHALMLYEVSFPYTTWH